MRLDKWTLAFGYTVLSGGNTPNWATSLGQSQIRNYRIKDDDPSINELLKGMTYCSVPVTDVSIRLGRGGSEVSGRQDGHPLVSAAVFSKVYINETLIQGGQFTLLIIRDSSPSHTGRLILKYAPSIKYTATLEAYSNEMFFNKVREQLDLADDACFFVSEINVVEQDKLVLKTHILDPQHSKTFANNEALNAAWNAVADFDISLPEDELGEPVTPVTELVCDSKINEADFRNWLWQQVKRDGKPLSDEYKNAYYYVLKAIPSMLGEEDVFSITSYDYFLRYRERITSSDAYAEANPNIGSGTLSGALSQYGNYLAERNFVFVPRERLVQILQDWWRNKYVEDNITSTLVGFGFKYARSLDKAKVSARSLLEEAKIETTMTAYIDRGKDLFYAIEKSSIGFSLVSSNALPSINPFNYGVTASGGVNKIFYGVPGCGKSYHIQHEILEANDYAEENIIRTTFYQDYSNTDFVGQILPKITKDANGEDVVEYIFNPGPFTLALIQAIKHPSSKVALVVEEINRGNAPAIFGDIFQLLDRDDSGISEYGIKNVNVIDYLEMVDFGTDGAPVHYTFEDIKLPGNLDIFATMNTSDQNVYTLDTAFTRRWAKERIENDFNGNSIETMRVPGMANVTWGAFVSAVNDRIRAKLDELQVNEDKQVGAFFVKKADLLTAEEAATCDEKKIRLFAYKVLEYLWDDVSKLDHTQLFNPAYTSFEKLVKDYVSSGSAVFNGEITFARVADSESAS